MLLFINSLLYEKQNNNNNDDDGVGKPLFLITSTTQH